MGSHALTVSQASRKWVFGEKGDGVGWLVFSKEEFLECLSGKGWQQ